MDMAKISDRTIVYAFETCLYIAQCVPTRSPMDDRGLQIRIRPVRKTVKITHHPKHEHRLRADSSREPARNVNVKVACQIGTQEFTVLII